MIQPNNHYLASRLTHQSYSGGDVCMYIKSNLECKYLQKPKLEFICGDFNVNFFSF